MEAGSGVVTLYECFVTVNRRANKKRGALTPRKEIPPKGEQRLGGGLEDPGGFPDLAPLPSLGSFVTSGRRRSFSSPLATGLCRAHASSATIRVVRSGIDFG